MIKRALSTMADSRNISVGCKPGSKDTTLRQPITIAAALLSSGCNSEERDAAIQVVNQHVPDSPTARYGSLHHHKTERGYDCIDVTFQRAADRSTVRAAALLENRRDHFAFIAFDQGNTCDELPHR